MMIASFVRNNSYIINTSLFIIKQYSKAKNVRSTAPLQLLKNKLSNSPSYPKKLQYLNSLIKQNDTQKLQNYFDHSTIDGFHIQDIFFYLSHKSLFKPPNHIVKYSLINNPNLDAYTKFIISLDIDAIEDQFIQIELIASFNQMCREMSPRQLSFCLTKIIQFESDSVEKLDQNALKYALDEIPTDNHELEYLQIFHAIQQLCLKNIRLKNDDIINKINRLKQIVMKPNTEIKYLYFLKYFESKCRIGSTIFQEQIRQKKIINTIGEGNPQFAVNFLQFYPHLTYSLRLDAFTPQLYAKYLQYLKQKRLSDPNFIIINHQLPYAIFTSNISIPLVNTNNGAHINKPKLKPQCFYKIFQLRLELGLDEQSNLGKHAKKIFIPNFYNTQLFVRFLSKNSINHNEVWLSLQQSIITKMHLHYPAAKRKQALKIMKQFDVIGLFRILGLMSMSRLGSYTFWNKINRLIFQIFEQPQILKQMTKKYQNRFVIYCFQLCRSNNLPTKVQEKMVDLALVAISNNRWTLRQIHTLIECLSYNKFGDDDLWYGIENKLLLINLLKIEDEHQQERIKRIFQSFNIMKKGSYKFFSRMSKLSYLKQDPQKAQEQNLQKRISK